MKKITISLIAVFFLLRAQAQADTTNFFAEMEKQMKTFRVDTSAVPNDDFTRAIRELRQLRGNFNINEAMHYDLEQQLKASPGDTGLLKQKAYFESAPVQRLLDNATIHIYRDAFSYNEVKQLVAFYKTSAGQKMSAMLPLIMVKTMAAADVIKSMLVPHNTEAMEKDAPAQ